MEAKTNIVYFGRDCVVSCDAKCEEAFGRNYHGDKTIPAPKDPGTYEGGHSKPWTPATEEGGHNKWCCRECERSTIAEL